MREPTPELMALGRAIREARERQGMSSAELARRAGLRRGRVKAIEAGRHDPGYFVLFDLRDGLGVPLTELLRRAEDIEQETGSGT